MRTDAGSGERGPRPIGRIIAELAAHSGFGRVLAMGKWEAAWQRAVGPDLAAQTRVSLPVRGRLEVLVAHSALLQELSFRKEELLEALRRQIPEEPVREIRFRLGSVDG